MSIPELTPVALGENLEGSLQDAQARRAKPLLVLGPSLGTSVTPLWAPAAEYLREKFDLVGWELPGHGRGGVVEEEFSVEELAEGVHVLARRVQEERGTSTEAYFYAGVSVGGAVGLSLALAHPDELKAIAAICTGAKIGDPSSWIERAQLVETSGTPTQVIGSAKKWFAPGFLGEEHVVGTELLHSLQEADRHNYGLVCRALARFDVRERLRDLRVPVLTMAGSNDVATPPESLRQIAEGVQDSKAVVFDEAAHLLPAEQPGRAASEIVEFFRSRSSGAAEDSARTADASSPILPDQDMSRTDVKAAGMKVRREVLSDEHVNQAETRTTAFTAPFQDFISRYAWGEIWTRPGLDRKTRSAITMTAMIALGHWSEFEMHVRAARRNGVTVEEIQEVILQSAIYCGVPAANTAFARAQEVLHALGDL
ncbi:bifunctional 3-oxoadipate enol-lactonase/4-carboxymuconolactone decarboxylase PcaDC [Rothia uropygialis]|uniref:bifunctional 3-oxoadipate enol-lactonase/4-carboxymuconolactone decarboxylase PcaDC n=1 Tax=Kocuria sp. 36 TaxID=1415402 RepID=UPI00101C3136